MATYTVRRATLDDLDILVRQRVRMFEDMGVLEQPGVDREGFTSAYREWLVDVMPAGTYVAWVVDHAEGAASSGVVSGGGATLIPWPPGPRYQGRSLAFVYNVYTEPEHRGRGLARMVMDAIHTFCRENAVGSVALNASPFGRPLYESMGYQVSVNPMMFLSMK
jgi:GNAT superfamily N-acetyltransferase